MSPAHQVQNMSSPLHSPAQTNLSPAYAMASVPFKSPSYQPGSYSYSGMTSQSPAYQSSSNLRTNPNNSHSPSYSPTTYSKNLISNSFIEPSSSPAYSPTTPNYNRSLA